MREVMVFKGAMRSRRSVASCHAIFFEFLKTFHVSNSLIRFTYPIHLSDYSLKIWALRARLVILATRFSSFEE